MEENFKSETVKDDDSLQNITKEHISQEEDKISLDEEKLNMQNEEKKIENIEEIEEIEDIKAIKKELEESKDKLLRALAENENTRKQMEKVRSEANRYGVQPLAREILNVVDNFDRALNSKGDNSEKTLEEGLNIIQKETLTILEKFNVKKIDAIGKEFNANYHQAMFEKESNDYKEGQVCEIVQDGYTFHDRLLRPVLVGVTKEKAEVTDEKIDEKKDTSIHEEDS